MNILLMLAHSIAEHDDVRMFHDLGYDVFSIGAYTNPASPGDDKRPPLPQVKHHPDLEALVPDQMAAKENLPPDLIDWADVIIVHHYLDQWVVRQWDRIRHKRVIWRTCGQSDNRLEMMMKPLRSDGLTIVRYSPAEASYFSKAGTWAGQDALIRFGKYPADYGGWTGSDGIVANVTQDMLGRGDWCGLTFWLQATQGLKASPAGPGSEKLPGGVGSLTYDGLRSYLRTARAYLYTGTMPASYTLGLIEAMMTGTPVVSIGAEAWMGPDELWEGEELTGLGFDDPRLAAECLGSFLRDHGKAVIWSERQRARAVELFGIVNVGAQWRALLGEP